MESEKLDVALQNHRTRFDRIDRRRKVDWQRWPDTSTQPQFVGDSLACASISRRPEIEDELLIAWGLAQAHAATGAETTIDVLHGEGTDLRKCPVDSDMSLCD
jgi:hypothetical protein